MSRQTTSSSRPRPTSCAAPPSSAWPATAPRASARTSSTRPTSTRRSRRCCPTLPLTGEWTLDSFSQHVGELDLFGAEPEQGVYRAYRRWAVESAALDLALRQAGRSLAAVVGREPQPVRFVCSLNMGHPPSMDGPARAAGRQPGDPLQAGRDVRLGRRDLRRAGVAGLRRLGRLQGRLPRHRGRPAAGSRCSTGGSPRPSPTPGWRIPT